MNRSLKLFTTLLAIGSTALFIAATASVKAAPADTAQPLPFHTIEGYGGGAITPIAYLVNPTPVKNGLGNPAYAISYVGLGRKTLSAITFTETVAKKFELGFGADQFSLGTLPSAVLSATKVDIDKSDVWLYNWNLRYQAVTESANIPAVTVGVHYKNNPNIGEINQSLGGALSTIGLEKTSGVDFTLTATKLFPKVEEHPLIVTAGLRESKAANLGFLGFGDSYKTTFEGNLVYLPQSKIVLAYEVRQKTNPYGSQLSPLIGGEKTWNAFDASYILDNHSTVVLGYGIFGTLANTDANNAYWIQLKENL